MEEIRGPFKERYDLLGCMGIYWVVALIFFIFGVSNPLFLKSCPWSCWRSHFHRPTTAKDIGTASVEGSVSFMHGDSADIFRRIDRLAWILCLLSVHRPAWFRGKCRSGQWHKQHKDSQVSSEMIDSLSKDCISPIHDIQGIFNNVFYGIITFYTVAALYGTIRQVPSLKTAKKLNWTNNGHISCYPVV